MQAGQTVLYGLPDKLLTYAQLLDNRAVSFDIILLQIHEQIAAMSNHFQQAAPRMMILLMDLEVLSKIVYAFGEQRDLNLRRTSVAIVSLILLNNSKLLFFQHYYHPSFNSYQRTTQQVIRIFPNYRHEPEA